MLYLATPPPLPTTTLSVEWATCTQQLLLCLGTPSLSSELPVYSGRCSVLVSLLYPMSYLYTVAVVLFGYRFSIQWATCLQWLLFFLGTASLSSELPVYIDICSVWIPLLCPVSYLYTVAAVLFGYPFSVQWTTCIQWSLFCLGTPSLSSELHVYSGRCYFWVSLLCPMSYLYTVVAVLFGYRFSIQWATYIQWLLFCLGTPSMSNELPVQCIEWLLFSLRTPSLSSKLLVHNDNCLIWVPPLCPVSCQVIACTQ